MVYATNMVFSNSLLIKATYTTENDRGRKVLSKVCPHCGKVFKKGYNMKIHVDRFHKEVNIFIKVKKIVI